MLRPLGRAADTHAQRLDLIGSDLWLSVESRPLRLRGQFIELDGGVLLAATLVIERSEQIAELGLRVGDFAPQDAGLDVMVLQNMRNLTEVELRSTVEELTQAISDNSELRAVESALAADLNVAADLEVRASADFTFDRMARVAVSLANGARVELEGPEREDALRRVRALIARYSPTLSPGATATELIEIDHRGIPHFYDARIARTADRGVLVVGRDITDERQRQADVEYRALHDPLTGLANRRLFLDRLTGALAEASTQVAVLAIDLNGFKGVNDVYGHAAGDIVLREAADRIRGCVRSEDTVARLGGDEFAVLVTSFDSRAAVADLAARIVEHVARPVAAEGSTVRVSATIGVAVEQGHQTVDALIRDADLAMYDARRRSDRVGWFAQKLRDEVDERRGTTEDLVAAIEKRTIELVFQPIVDLASREPVGFEALARWNHPVRGPISPEVFIGLAERSGNIGALDRLVAEVATASLADFDRMQPDRQLFMSINVSPLSLRPALAAELEDLTKSKGLDPRLLTIEITETTFLADIVQAELSLAEIGARGMGIALDDFGTGYSSLTHLHRLPIDEVKIDRSFVTDVATHERARRLVGAAIGMAEATGATVVAEGIETEHQAAMLTDLGCLLGQGYLFARPMPATDVEAYLAGFSRTSIKS